MGEQRGRKVGTLPTHRPTQPVAFPAGFEEHSQRRAAAPPMLGKRLRPAASH